MNRNKLVVLDLDNTLLHTWVPDALPPFIADDDPHRSAEQRQRYAAQLLAEFPNVQIWNDAIICPRPYLAHFIQILIDAPDCDIGIYSTAAPVYITMSLGRVAPALLKHARFVWGKAECYKMGGKRYKDLHKVSKQFDMDLKNILMIDDFPSVLPEINRLPIQPFRVDIDLELAMQDDQLKQVYLEIQKFLNS